MAIRGDSWSSTTDVRALTRHLLRSEASFNSTTRPTLTELEGFIDEASGVLNLALYKAGFAPATVRANSTAKQAMDNWVRFKTASYVHLVSPYSGVKGDEDNPASIIANMAGDACEFVEGNKQALINASISQSTKASDGLQFSGLTVQADRTDPDDTSREQPKFKRGQFDR